MDKCREDFELYMLQSGYTECALSKSNHYDCYHDITIDAMYSAWKAGWKASRENMKAIKLPNELVPDYEGDVYKSNYDAVYCKGYNDALSLAEDAITSAGYKVE